jgi:hypothetical protein
MARPRRSNFTPDLQQLVAQDNNAPKCKDEFNLLLGVLDDDVNRTLFRSLAGGRSLGRHYPLLEFDVRHPRTDHKTVKRLDQQDGDNQAHGGYHELGRKNPLVSGDHKNRSGAVKRPTLIISMR